MTSIAGILFDKDGTLFDFHATWSGWTGDFLANLSRSEDHAVALAEAVRYDRAERRFLPDSPFIAGSVEDWMSTILPHLPWHDRETLRSHILETSALARQVPVAPLDPLLGSLRADGYRLGVATNDGIKPATRQLRDAGIESHFDFVAGYDSGWGAKPAPGMLLAFSEQTGIAPGAVAMIGDSRHDLQAARAAGMRPVAVLTGFATEADLAPLADVVLPSIADLPDWLNSGKPTP